MAKLLRNISLLLLLAFLVPVLFLAQGPVFTTGQWVTDRTLHDARVGACTVTLADGRMLATGGQGSAGALTSAEYLSVAGDLSTVALMNVAHSEHVCAALPDGSVLVAGGRVSGSAATNAAEIYSPAANTWTNITSMREARIGAAVTVLADGRVLIAGGEASGVASATLEIYNPGSQSFALVSGAMSSPRKNLAAARLSDGRVLIAGGSNGAAALATAEIFDPATGALSPAGNMSSPRTGLSATALDNGKVLVAGGSNGAQDLATSELFDPQTGAFAGGASMASPRRGHQALLIPHNNNVLVVGGTSTGQPLASTEQFAWWSNAFTSLGSVSAARSLMTGGAGPTGLVTVAGGSLADGTASASQDTILLPTVQTDKPDYQPGDVAAIAGAGWKAGETVNLLITETPDLDNDSPIALTATADGAGNFSSTLQIDTPDLGVKFVLVATGQTSGLSAETGFTDSTRNLKLTFAGTGSGSVMITASIGTVNAPASCGGTGTDQASQTVTSTCSPNITFSDSTATVTFNESAALGSTFAGWSAPLNLTSSTCTGTINPCSAGFNGNPQLTVTFNAAAAVSTTTSIASTLNPSVYGDLVTFNATVTPASGPAIGCGTVAFKDGGTTFATVNVVSGAASTSISTLSAIASPHSITAVYTPAASGCSFLGSTSSALSQVVNKKAASVTPNAASKTYGSADPAFTGTLSGFLAADAVTATYSRTAGETVAGSPYTISAVLSPAGALGNYTITYNTANFTINPKAASV
ncbi:MAG TPA: kelch repeat-containing protein, partial [Bryobacteraceae bacterium]|nr:kelch repeat-containing protein [Bryobacteraceae bacterium]